MFKQHDVMIRMKKILMAVSQINELLIILFFISMTKIIFYMLKILPDNCGVLKCRVLIRHYLKFSITQYVKKILQKGVYSITKSKLLLCNIV